MLDDGLRDAGYLTCVPTLINLTRWLPSLGAVPTAIIAMFMNYLRSKGIKIFLSETMRLKLAPSGMFA
jgi:hypothetical protein